MASRDPRKLSAFESGMRGSEKPKVTPEHGHNQVNQGEKGGEHVQKPKGEIGDPGGVDLPAYTSGMRGMEKPKQKTAEGATDSTGNSKSDFGGGERRQGANSVVGTPKGVGLSGTEAKYENSLGEPRGEGRTVSEGEAQKKASEAYKLGIPGNNTEAATSEVEPIGAEEDDTHINVRIPKASLKRKSGGLGGN